MDLHDSRWVDVSKKIIYLNHCLLAKSESEKTFCMHSCPTSYWHVYEEFDILDKAIATITDNASNFVKTFRLYGSKSNHQMITPNVTTVPAPAMTVEEDADILDVLDEENSEFDETDDDWDDIGGDHVVDDRELGERKDEDPHDEEHKRPESDIFDQTIPLIDILDERFTSENVYVLPPHRRCAFHTLNLICKCDIYKNMEPSLKKLFESTDKKFNAI
ncbi:hypothetical protein OUZ56_012560 [Daphnia magna]|uniref:Uncharacterized protein n=1 Tax=Daphnia magna TaxID=35525 RepID=A0ABQ9Z3D8_9CRUS|nr:hypothetical protein OUZ56_012560 [Daphnia magna]